MLREPRLYMRKNTWWANFGTVGGIEHRRSTHETDIEKAKIAAAAMNAEIERHKRKRYIAAIVKPNPPKEWAEFISSEEGESMVMRLWRNARSRSRRDGIECRFSSSDCRLLLLRSDGLCEVTGLHLSRTARPRDPFKPSVDRIDNSLGYSIGNCRITMMAVNLAMNVWGEDTFKTIALAYASRRLTLLVQLPVQENSYSEMLS